MNHFENLEASLLQGSNEIRLDDGVIRQAQVPLKRMVEFSNA